MFGGKVWRWMAGTLIWIHGKCYLSLPLHLCTSSLSGLDLPSPVLRRLRRQLDHRHPWLWVHGPHGPGVPLALDGP